MPSISGIQVVRDLVGRGCGNVEKIAHAVNDIQNPVVQFVAVSTGRGVFVSLDVLDDISNCFSGNDCELIDRFRRWSGQSVL